jgi:hypothetical protein
VFRLTGYGTHLIAESREMNGDLADALVTM